MYISFFLQYRYISSAGYETDSMCTRSAVHACTDRSDFSSLLLLVSTRSFFFFAFFSFRFSLLLRRNPVGRGHPKCRTVFVLWYMWCTSYSLNIYFMRITRLWLHQLWIHLYLWNQYSKFLLNYTKICNIIICYK